MQFGLFLATDATGNGFVPSLKPFDSKRGLHLFDTSTHLL